MRAFTFVAFLLSLTACAAVPCKTAELLGGYRGEMRQCVDMADTEEEGLACLEKVDAEYDAKFKAEGENLADITKDLVEKATEVLK